MQNKKRLGTAHVGRSQRIVGLNPEMRFFPGEVVLEYVFFGFTLLLIIPQFPMLVYN
jgi:hypothetical protein